MSWPTCTANASVKGLADEEWLRDAGKRGWVVLMKDAKIRYRPAELQVVIDHGLRTFCLTNANLRGIEMAARFVANLPRIIRIATEARPVHLWGLRRRAPADLAEALGLNRGKADRPPQ